MTTIDLAIERTRDEAQQAATLLLAGAADVRGLRQCVTDWVMEEVLIMGGSKPGRSGPELPCQQQSVAGLPMHKGSQRAGEWACKTSGEVLESCSPVSAV